MLIAIIGNNPSLNEIAAQSIIGHFKGIVDGIEVKGVKDLPNHRRNRQMFGEPDFDNWIITGIETQEDFNAVKEEKAFTICVVDELSKKPEWSNEGCNHYINLFDRSTHILDEELRTILVKEKLIYPSAREETKIESLVKQGINFEGMNVECDYARNDSIYISTKDEGVSLTKRQALELKNFLNYYCI